MAEKTGSIYYPLLNRLFNIDISTGCLKDNAGAPVYTPGLD